MSALGLIETARALVADDKGLLAMDESKPTCNKRFAALGISQTVEARRSYRELIVTTPSLGECISGLILYDETIRQTKKDGTPFFKIIVDAGIGDLEHNGVDYPFGEGDVLLLPAVVGACSCRPNGNVTVLEISLPQIR